jgi:hypothetical protein
MLMLDHGSLSNLKLPTISNPAALVSSVTVAIADKSCNYMYIVLCTHIPRFSASFWPSTEPASRTPYHTLSKFPTIEHVRSYHLFTVESP